MKPLKIYLGDLTYDTITLSTETMPLNIGYLAAYCKEKFGASVEITLFKYIEKLDKAIHDSPPDILGLGNYCWSRNVSVELFRMLEKQNPYAITVWGGPNFPMDMPSQQKFMEKYSEVDVYIPYDGEVGLNNLIELALQANTKEELKKISRMSIEGCVTRDKDGKLQYTFANNRIRELDVIPSPYLNGMMNKFFDGRLSPMLQTNRGCPFSCTFCTDGADAVNQVNKFSLDRVKSEINYIAEKAPSTVHSMIISDLNFGMYPRDLEICNYIVNAQQEFNYPKRVVATTGKNKREQIIEAIKRLNGTMTLLMSVQSLDTQVQKNIRRSNISAQQLMDLAPAIKEADLRTTTEIILSLPGETYESHITSLKKLVAAKVDDIVVHTCMLLDGAEMNTPKERQKWDLKTKFRLLPRDFARLSNGKIVLEPEEVVIASNTLSFDEYTELRLIAFSIFVTNRGVVYDSVLKLLRECNVDLFELFYRTVTNLKHAPENVRKIFEEYKTFTIDELWDSEEDLIEYYQKEENYQKLLEEKAGINVMHHMHAIITSEYMEDWTEYLLNIAYDLIKEQQLSNIDWQDQLKDVGNYCRGISYNVMGNDRMQSNPQFNFQYDIPKWLAGNDELPLKVFKLFSKTSITFLLSDEQYKLVQDNLDIYGDSPNGKGQVLKKIPKQMLWRHPVAIDKHKKITPQHIDKSGTWSNFDDGTFAVPQTPEIRYDEEVSEFDQ